MKKCKKFLCMTVLALAMTLLMGTTAPVSYTHLNQSDDSQSVTDNLGECGAHLAHDIEVKS